MVASPFYHRLHVVQLRVMHRLTGRDIFLDYADRWENYTRQPCEARSRPLLQERLQAVLLLGTREDPLRFTIFSAGDGSARGSRGGTGAALGASRTRRHRSHRISEPSDGRRASGMAATLRHLVYREDVGRSAGRPHLALPLPNRKAHERMLNYGSFCVSAAMRGLRLPRPDVVIATSPQLLVGLSGWWLARWKRVPFVFEVRDLWPESLTAVGMGEANSLLHRLLGAIAGFLYRMQTASSWSPQRSRNI